MSAPRTAAGRALLAALSNLPADLPLECGDEPLERLDIEATMRAILAIEAEAEAAQPAPELADHKWGMGVCGCGKTFTPDDFEGYHRHLTAARLRGGER